MEKEYKYLLHLLKSFVQETAPEVQYDIDWQMLIHLAKIHSVDGIVGFMVRQYKIPTSPEIAMDMRQRCLVWFSMYARRAEQMKQLIQKMNEREIDHLLFKGYIVRDYYPVPELRSFGDIDFIIREEDRQKSHQLMLDLGFTVDHDWEPVLSYAKGTEYYEIHTDIMELDVSDKYDYKGYFKDMWDHARKQDGYTWHFTPEYHFIYLLTHIAKHIYSSGAGVRMYLDLAVFIKHFGMTIDWQWIGDELKKIQLFDFYCTALSCVEDWFGVKSPIKMKEVSRDVKDEFMVYTLEAGVFGHHDREAGVNVLKNKSDDEKGVSRVKVLVQRLFPPAEQIENRYTYLQGKHWLLPAAWVHRFFKTRKTWGRHAHEAQVIMSADTEEVTKLKKLCREIGL